MKNEAYNPDRERARWAWNICPDELESQQREGEEHDWEVLAKRYSLSKKMLAELQEVYGNSYECEESIELIGKVLAS